MTGLSYFPAYYQYHHCTARLGHECDHPELQSQIRELERLEIEERDTLRVAPCFSPIWDTAITIVALAESGVSPEHEALQKASEWLLSKEVKVVGDWKIKNPDGEPGGWYFEYANEFYPDVDDTFQVITALSKVRFTTESKEKEKREAIQRALKWASRCRTRMVGGVHLTRVVIKNSSRRFRLRTIMP